MDVAQALAARRSVRGFSSTPVDRALLTQLFEQAQRAPSWCNIQPWRVRVFSGDAKDALVSKITAAALAGVPSTDYTWPVEYPEPYGTHRRDCGKALYGAMGVERNDHPARQAAWLRNFVAFDAPHVAMVGLDKRLGFYAGLDLGCWLQSFLLAATEAGIGTCPQAALGLHADAVRSMLDWEESIGLVFGIAIGYEDKNVPANACITSRASLSENVRFIDAC